MSLNWGELQESKLNDIKHGGIYTICCFVHDCPCGTMASTCPRGFFSLFIQAVYGIELAKRYGIPYYIDFGNHKYLYTDPSRTDKNFWNYYFNQFDFQREHSSHFKLVRNSLQEIYPFRIWKRSHFIKMNREVVSKLLLRDKIRELFSDKTQFFEAHKILGVQIRRTDHGQEIEQVELDKFLSTIDSKLRSFEYLFLATDDSNVLQLLLERYPKKIIYNEAVRSENEEAVHSNLAIVERYELGEQALIDSFCLSLCSHSILIQSNISYAALLFNPKLSYTLLENASFPVKLRRFLSLFFDEVKLKLIGIAKRQV